ncbi:hypothetical protein FF021_21445, partial [Leptospira noguchii]
GSHAVTYNADGNVYGWAATNGGFQSGVLVSSFDPYTTANPMYEYCQQNPGSFWCIISPPSSSTITVDPNASSGYYSEGHYEAVCHGADVGGTCLGGSGHYALDTTSCSGWAYCGYDRSWVTDDSYSTSVSESFSQAQK